MSKRKLEKETAANILGTDSTLELLKDLSVEEDKEFEEKIATTSLEEVGEEVEQDYIFKDGVNGDIPEEEEEGEQEEDGEDGDGDGEGEEEGEGEMEDDSGDSDDDEELEDDDSEDEQDESEDVEGESDEEQINENNSEKPNQSKKEGNTEGSENDSGEGEESENDSVEEEESEEEYSDTDLDSDDDYADSNEAGTDSEEDNPYKYYMDENVEHKDPYYYDREKDMSGEVTYFKSSKKKDKKEVDGAGDDIQQPDNKEETNKESETDNKTEEISLSRRIDDSKPQDWDEYADGDSSDEEEIRNTIGNIPTEWYDEYEHIGYNHSGQKILKPDRGDSLDAFLQRIEDPEYRRTVIDRLTGQDVKLVDKDLDLINRLIRSHVPSSQYQLYEPFLDLYSHEVMETPISGRPDHKRSFQPSKSERERVSRMVHAIKRQLIHKHTRPQRYRSYDIWKSDNLHVPLRRRLNMRYRAPAVRLPTNTNSYNPPPEFLPTEKQLEAVAKMRSSKFKHQVLARLPIKYSSLRLVPTYKTYLMDIFNRCLDLYMSSRFAYRKVVGKSKDLLPNLPRPRDLRPYPTKECLMFKGHRSIVRAMSAHPLGKILATGSDDHTVKIWEVSTGRCLRTLNVGDGVACVAWNPNSRVFLLAVAVTTNTLLINPENYLTDKSIVTRTNALFKAVPEQGDYMAPEKVRKNVRWEQPSQELWEQGVRVVISHNREVTQVVWHQQGDYFATLQPTGKTASVITHQLSRHRSQMPFANVVTDVTNIAFHPKKAYFYICSQGRIRVYSLIQQRLITMIRSQSSTDWISSLAVHPQGEHFIVGSFSRKITWYEMESTNRPFTLRYHHGAVRSLAFHPKYPLFASASDDGRVIVTHAMVYRDWVKDPLLVPVKELRGHEFFDKLCVLRVEWHPHAPFLFTAGADSTVRMWQ